MADLGHPCAGGCSQPAVIGIAVGHIVVDVHQSRGGSATELELPSGDRVQAVRMRRLRTGTSVGRCVGETGRAG